MSRTPAGTRGRVLAQAVSSHKGWGGNDVRTQRLFHSLHARQADGHDSRLGVDGTGQLLLRPLKHEAAEGRLENLVDLIEHRTRGGGVHGELPAHAHVLGTLAGKEESRLSRTRKHPVG